MKAVILAGGSGTRLFPLSRKNYPKQFLKIGSNKSLFQNTVLRLSPISKDPIIITNKEYKFHVINQLKEIGITNYHLIEEPVGRNTAPAIALVLKFAIEQLDLPEDEVLGIFPSDHLIEPTDLFVDYVKKAEKVAKDYLITFGIKPTNPETGYGYIESGEKINDYTYKVVKFHEKPSLEKAQSYIQKGNYYWNSGMFAFTISNILQELKKHSLDIYQLFQENSYQSLLENFQNMPDISIDYAIMEKTDKAAVIPLDLKWSDLGSWDSVYQTLDKDQNQNVKEGKVVDIDTKNSVIISNKRLITTISVEDLVIVETDDVILIAKKGETQKVKDLVNTLKENPQYKEITEIHKTVYRPWGSYTELEEGERYRIKRIVVNPGESLSMQMHHHRSEHWVVVRGTAKVILEDIYGKERKEYYIHENESIYVPKSTKHRLSNPGKIPLEIIEIQVGEYVKEDDIIRFEDNYGRT
ncbi:mannose-1-phosphate guanylyltransferase/mannose-6-phosphate isomerase [Sulfurihydrogenibium azorense]|uniref:mannose-1-phosphate guanylyltransferase/mannose-6-phosphate isomerase n=1 Tax=Sulfurihydrogenibium azorense TaxID=309806 RepID=UPI00391B5933